MGVGVGVGRFAVRGPSGVTNASMTESGLLAEKPGEFINTTGLLAKLKTFFVDSTESGRIITTVFESTETFNEDGLGWFFAYVTDDAAHIVFSKFVLQECNHSLASVIVVMVNRNGMSLLNFYTDEERLAVCHVIVN